MELIPQALVVGSFLPPNMPGMGALDREKINRIWSELAPRYHLTQLQMTPDGSGANFVGAAPEDGVTIQVPLIQVRLKITTTADEAGRSAQSMLGVISRHAGATQLFNLGVRLIYTAPLADNDARAFIFGQLLSGAFERLDRLATQQDQAWAGVKYVVPHTDRNYTVNIEPLQADQMKSLYIDVDTAFMPGPFAPDSVASHVEEVREFISGALKETLEGPPST
jgi:hypothetical protein